MFTNIIDALENAATEFKDKTIYYGISSSDYSLENQITFSQLNQLTLSIGTGIVRALGDRISPQPICVMTGRHLYTPACFLGVARAGCFYAPIDADLPEARILQILSVSNPKYIIVDLANLERVTEIAQKGNFDSVILVMEDLMKEVPDEDLLLSASSHITEKSPLYMIFTSGSTGKPKGVLTANFSLMCYLDGLNRVIELNETDVLGNQSPLDYIAAIRDLYLPLVTGCSTVIIPRSLTAMPKELFEILNQYEVTTLCWSASGLEVLSQLGAFDDEDLELPKHIRRIVFSGSVMHGKHLRKMQLGLPNTKFINQYGPTEATASCTYYPVNETVEEDTVLPIGKAYKHYHVFLLDEDDTEATGGEIGEICVSGPPVALGYYGAPDQTANVFTQNPLISQYNEIIYRTGDLGKHDENGNLLFLGRKDRQIKHMGHRIELAEIESEALKIPEVEDAISMYDSEKSLLYLFYTGEATAKSISLTFRADMPNYMVPRKIVNLEEIPKLPNGKINMPELKKLM